MHGERGQKKARRSGRVEQRPRLHAALFGDDLGHHRRARRPLAPDAQARDDPEQQQDGDVGRKGAAGRPRSVQQHGQQEGLGASDLVREAAKQHSPCRPAQEQGSGQNTVPVQRGGFGGGGAEGKMQQRRDTVRRDVVEQQAVKHVKAPAQPGRKKDCPLVAVHSPEAACRRVGCDGHETRTSSGSRSRSTSPSPSKWTASRAGTSAGVTPAYQTPSG